jgi:hypothetical protein
VGQDLLLVGGGQALPGAAKGQAEIDGDVEADLVDDGVDVGAHLRARAGDARRLDQAGGPGQEVGDAEVAGMPGLGLAEAVVVELGQLALDDRALGAGDPGVGLEDETLGEVVGDGGQPEQAGTWVRKRTATRSSSLRVPRPSRGGVRRPASAASCSTSRWASSSPSSSSPVATRTSNGTQASAGVYQMPVCTGVRPATGATSGCG